jgi:hypothetical protein
MVTAVDSESELISAGNLAPRLVCVSYCSDTDFKPKLLHHTDSYEVLEQLLKRETIVGANFSFDAAVIARKHPQLLPLIFQAYFDGRVLDVQLAQRLIDLARGELDGYRTPTGEYVRYGYSLAALHERHGFGLLEKQDTWRLRYGELIDVPLERWPAAAKQYALDDATAPLKVYRAQLQYEEFLKDLPAQSRASFALHLMSCRGMITDARRCDEYINETRREIERCRLVCVDKGIVRDNGSRDTKKAKALMLAACERYDIAPKLTQTGGVSLDAEACRDSGDEVLQAYSTYSSSNTILTRAENFKRGSTGVPLQTSFVTLLNNGRTASRAPSPPLIGDNLQNLPRKGKLRNVFIPRPGFLFVSIDYSMAEIHTFAQVELWKFGTSKLADALNEQKDVHCMLAATMMRKSYEEVLANKKHGEYARQRQLAKAGNFGALGGMGAKRFMLQTNMTAESREQRIDLATAQHVLKSWRETWSPEKYFEWCSSMLGEAGAGVTTVKQFVSERVRAHIGYSELCNTFFSGLAADAGKAALLPVSFECYCKEDSPAFGSRPVLYIHDELIAEVPEEKASEASFRLRDIMVEVFNKYTPDVPVRAEPALQRCWYKSAEPVYDEKGRLIPWEPSTTATK